LTPGEEGAACKLRKKEAQSNPNPERKKKRERERVPTHFYTPKRGGIYSKGTFGRKEVVLFFLLSGRKPVFSVLTGRRSGEKKEISR